MGASKEQKLEFKHEVPAAILNEAANGKLHKTKEGSDPVKERENAPMKDQLYRRDFRNENNSGYRGGPRQPYHPRRPRFPNFQQHPYFPFTNFHSNPYDYSFVCLF